MEFGIYHVSVLIFEGLAILVFLIITVEFWKDFFSTLKLLAVTVSRDRFPSIIAQNISPLFLNLCQVQVGASMT